MGLRAPEAWERKDADEGLFRVRLGLALGDAETREAALAILVRVISVFLTGADESGSVAASELAILSRSSSSWRGSASLRILFWSASSSLSSLSSCGRFREGWGGEEGSSRLVAGDAGVSLESGRSFIESLARVASTIRRAGDIPVFTVSALDDRPMVLSLAAELVVAVLLALRMELAEE